MSFSGSIMLIEGDRREQVDVIFSAFDYKDRSLDRTVTDLRMRGQHAMMIPRAPFS